MQIKVTDKKIDFDFSLDDELVFELLSNQLSKIEQSSIQKWIDKELYAISPIYIDSEYKPLQKLFTDVIKRVNGDSIALIEEFNKSSIAIAEDNGLYYCFTTNGKAIKTSVINESYSIINSNSHPTIEAAIGNCGVKSLKIVPPKKRKEMAFEFFFDNDCVGYKENSLM